jgi:cell wall-associated NlpC family hydrolase
VHPGTAIAAGSWLQRHWRPLAGILAAAVVTVGGGVVVLGGAALSMFSGQAAAQMVAQTCAGQGGGATAGLPPASATGQASIPAGYLSLYRRAGKTFRVPWPVLAGIGEVESDHGRSTLPGVHSGENAFGAAGPMQIGVAGAAGNTWGGAPVHPASERVAGVATDFNGDGTASVYDPADAIAGAAKYLAAHGAQSNVSGAIFAYNHLTSYVQAVLRWASVYTGGGFTVTRGVALTLAQCLASINNGGPGSGVIPNQVVANVIAYARAQLGKPYQWGATGPGAFDCSGLVMMAYRAAGIDIPRTAQLQWAWGPTIQPGQEQPGDLVFFAGSDGTATSPGHVGLVIGPGEMIEAYATSFPIRVAPFGSNAAAGDQVPVGFTRPSWSRFSS